MRRSGDVWDSGEKASGVTVLGRGVYERSSLAELLERMRSVEVVESVERTDLVARELVDAVWPAVEEMRAKGYSLRSIAEFLVRDAGVRASVETIRTAMAARNRLASATASGRRKSVSKTGSKTGSKSGAKHASKSGSRSVSKRIGLVDVKSGSSNVMPDVASDVDGDSVRGASSDVAVGTDRATVVTVSGTSDVVSGVTRDVSPDVVPALAPRESSKMVSSGGSPGRLPGAGSGGASDERGVSEKKILDTVPRGSGSGSSVVPAVMTRVVPGERSVRVPAGRVAVTVPEGHAGLSDDDL